MPRRQRDVAGKWRYELFLESCYRPELYDLRGSYRHAWLHHGIYTEWHQCRRLCRCRDYYNRYRQSAAYHCYSGWSYNLRGRIHYTYGQRWRYVFMESGCRPERCNRQHSGGITPFHHHLHGDRYGRKRLREHIAGDGECDTAAYNIYPSAPAYLRGCIGHPASLWGRHLCVDAGC